MLKYFTQFFWRWLISWHLSICFFQRNCHLAWRRDIIKRLIQRREGPSVIRWLLCCEQFAWVLLCHHLDVIAAHLRERWERFQCYSTLFELAAQHSRHSSACRLFSRVSVTTAPSPVRLDFGPTRSQVGLNVAILLYLIDSLANLLL